MAGQNREAELVIDLASLARSATRDNPLWSYQGEDLNANLLVFDEVEGIATHRNNEVDVLVIGIAGEGIVEIDGRAHAVTAGQACLIPKGKSRAIHSAGARFAYLTCHRRRGQLWPDNVTASANP